MELYLFRPAEYQQLYNCSLYSIDQVPFEERQHVFLGIIFIIITLVSMIFYIPCIFALGKRLKQSCYKFLFFLGIIDILCLPICGFMTGYFAITGVVFCSYPTFLFFTVFWIVESITAVILAFSRCCEVISPHSSYKLFDGQKTWWWIAFAFLYGLLYVTFNKPIVYSGVSVAWFFFPHVGYIEDVGRYGNEWVIYHDIIVCFSICALYLLFILIFFAKYYFKRESRILNASNASAQKMAFFQALVIACVNAVCSGVYNYMQVFPVSKTVVLIASFSWVLCHGTPPILFMTVNKTLRQDCIRIIKVLLKKKEHTSVVTIVLSTVNYKAFTN